MSYIYWRFQGSYLEIYIFVSFLLLFRENGIIYYFFFILFFSFFIFLFFFEGLVYIFFLYSSPSFMSCPVILICFQKMLKKMTFYIENFLEIYIFLTYESELTSVFSIKRDVVSYKKHILLINSMNNKTGMGKHTSKMSGWVPYWQSVRLHWDGTGGVCAARGYLSVWRVGLCFWERGDCS